MPSRAHLRLMGSTPGPSANKEGQLGLGSPGLIKLVSSVRFGVLLAQSISQAQLHPCPSGTWPAAARPAFDAAYKTLKKKMEENSSTVGIPGIFVTQLPSTPSQTPRRQLEVGPWLFPRSPSWQFHQGSGWYTHQSQAVMDYCSLWLLFTAQSNLGDTHISQFRDFFYFIISPALSASGS